MPAVSSSRKRKKIEKESLTLLFIALPFVIFIIMFSYVPLMGWVLAFFNYKPGMPFNSMPFVGLRYFNWIFTNEFPEIKRVMVNTLALSGLGLLFSPMPMLLSLLLNEVFSTKYKRVVQTVTTLPNFVSWVIIFSLAFGMFSTEGIVNSMLMNLGLIEKRLMVLDNVNIVWGFQTAMGIWKGLGWGAIIYIAAITGIDTELYEAATVDGAGRLARAIYITIPGLLPTYFVLLLLSIGGLLSAAGLDQYLVFHNGLVAPKIETLDYYVYRVGILANSYSFTIAVGILKSLISITLLFSANLLSKRVRGASIF